jgi:hypothetical protein
MDYLSTILGDNLISWHSSKQGCYTHSSSDAEYVALSTHKKEIRWQQQLMEDIGSSQTKTITYEDNQSAIAMTQNPQENHKRTKHIQVSFHSTREYVKQGIISLNYVPTKEQLADYTTTILSGPTLRLQLKRMGLSQDTSNSERQLKYELTQQSCTNANKRTNHVDSYKEN